MVAVSHSVAVDVNPVVTADVRFRFLRDGVVTSGKKTIRVTRNITESQLFFGMESEDGEHTKYFKVPVGTLADQDHWVLLVEDLTTPVKVHGQTLEIAGSGMYTINILTGSGSEATDPGVVAALARVEGAQASREIVVVERKLDGDWRVAGNGVTDAAGDLLLEVDVVDGALYALGLDDFGAPFTPGLSVPVGRRIRPSVFAGVLYEITEAGVLPAAEPAWWPITTEGSRELGTARAVAVRYFQPIGHGPITVEMI